MSHQFGPVYIVSEDETIIPLKKIESINIRREDDDRIIDKLRDDHVIYVTTVSGRIHEISAKKQIETFKNCWDIPHISTELINAILQKWMILNE